MNPIDDNRQRELEAIWQQMNPIMVGEDRFIHLPALQAAVGETLYPDGIHDDAAYDHVLAVTAELAAVNGFAGNHELRPPQVTFAAAGTYLKQQPTLNPALLTEKVLGKPLFDSRSPLTYYAVRTVRNEVAWALHDAPFNKLQPPVADMLRQQIDTAMTAAGWTLSQHSGRPRYEREVQPNFDGLHDRLVTWLQQQTGNVYHHKLVHEATHLAYGKAYADVPALRETLRPVLDLLPDALKAAKYDPTVHDGGLYQARPLTVDDALAEKLRAALDAVEPRTTKLGAVLPLAAVWKAICTALNMPPEQMRRTHRAQIERDHLHPWLRARRYRSKKVYIYGRDCEPTQRDGFEAFQPECHIVQDDGHLLSFGSGNNRTLPVFAPLCIVDTRNNAVVCLQLLGNPQAVKANWAKLMSAYQSPVSIDGAYIRQRGMKQHIALKKPLPLGQVDWVILHKQASVREMRPDEPFYVLDDGTMPVPPTFFPMLDAALAVPLQPQWADTLWEAGRGLHIIVPVTERSHGMMAWQVQVTGEAWEKIIIGAVQSGKLHILHKGRRLEPDTTVPGADDDAPAVFHEAEIGDMAALAIGDALQLFAGNGMVQPAVLLTDTNLISVYTVDDAVADGTHFDAGAMQSNGDPVPVVAPRVTKFNLGRIVVTQGAIALYEDYGISLQACLNRHAVCDWGDTAPDDCRTNDAAVKNGDDRMLSSYKHAITETDSAGEPKSWTERVWIETNWNRSVTTLMRPDEY